MKPGLSSPCRCTNESQDQIRVLVIPHICTKAAVIQNTTMDEAHIPAEGAPWRVWHTSFSCAGPIMLAKHKRGVVVPSDSLILLLGFSSYVRICQINKPEQAMLPEKPFSSHSHSPNKTMVLFNIKVFSLKFHCSPSDLRDPYREGEALDSD